MAYLGLQTNKCILLTLNLWISIFYNIITAVDCALLSISRCSGPAAWPRPPRSRTDTRLWLAAGRRGRGPAG